MNKDLNIILKRWLWRRLREGRCFKNISSAVKEIDGFSKQEIEKLQAETLKEIIRHSYRNVPYYRRIFDAIGLDVNDRFSPRDMTKIPFTTKDEILRNPYDFISTRSKRIFLRKANTSGTTGTPITLFRDLYSINFENAIVWKQRNWAGIKKGDRKAILKGELIIPTTKKDPPFWKYDYLNKELILSFLHISRDTVRYYVDALKDFKPSYIEAYPDSLYILAKFIKESGLDGVSFKAAITSSDTLHDDRRAFIEDVFNCKVFDFYGTAERVLAIATCPSGNYHILPEYGYAEFLDCKENKDYKEIVGTSFINMAMPLIRYRTGDVVVLSKGKCQCGRESQMVKKVAGRRLSEFIITPEGRYISLMDCAYKGMDNIIESQMIQEDYDVLRVRLVPGKDFRDVDKDTLINNILVRVGNNMKVYVEKVDSIERTPNGKFKAIVSNIITKAI